MITDEDLFRAGAALDDRFGAERATAFGQALPALVSHLVEQWGLEVREGLPSGATSVVLAVTDRTGVPAVLKVSPDAEFLARQSQMLARLAPTGRVPRILQVDPSAGAVLLEQVLPGETLDSSRAAPPTPQEWAALLEDLHGTSTVGVIDVLRQRCEDVFRRIGARRPPSG